MRVVPNVPEHETHRGASWLARIERLKYGERCEVKIDRLWVPAHVFVNGGPGIWLIAVDAPERHLGDARMLLLALGYKRDEPHTARRHIEHVRCPGQEEAWPRI